MVEQLRGDGDGGGVQVQEAGAEERAQDGLDLREEVGFVVGVFLVCSDCGAVGGRLVSMRTPVIVVVLLLLLLWLLLCCGGWGHTDIGGCGVGVVEVCRRLEIGGRGG